MPCNPGMKVIGWQPETNDRPFPHCCPQPICEGHPFKPYTGDFPAIRELPR